jgi:predicted nucleic acid binding AN1-type Zn finger protein
MEWIMILIPVIIIVVVIVAIKSRKKTSRTAPQRKTFGVKQPKKRRTGSPASVPPSGTSASTFAHYECPDCHSDNIIQYQDGAESCSDCGWKS